MDVAMEMCSKKYNNQQLSQCFGPSVVHLDSFF